MSGDKLQRRRRGHGEGSISLYKDGRWCARINLGHEPKRDREGKIVYQDGRVIYVRKRKVIYGKTRKDVADKLKAELAKQQQGFNVAPERQTVAQFLEHWISTNVEPSAAPGTVTKYRQWSRVHIEPAIGRVHLAKLTPQHVEALVQQTHRGGLAASGVRRMLGMLRSALTVALKYGLVSRNVAELVDAPRVEAFDPTVLTFAQAEQLLTSSAEHRLYALWLAALMLGLREGELLGLRWADVDLDDAMLRVAVQLVKVKRPGEREQLLLMPPKTKHSRRTLPIPAELIAALRQHRARQLQERMLAGSRWQEHDLVFPTTLGTPMRASNLLKTFDAVLKQAGLPHIRIHDLRHSCSTFLAALGVDLKTAMEILGHTNMRMTLHYTHALEESKQQAVTRIGKRFGGSEEAVS